MKKILLFLLFLLSTLAVSADKTKKEPEMLDVQTQMEKADKIESYRAKKDVAWHKTEYNKVLKYLKKKKWGELWKKH